MCHILGLIVGCVEIVDSAFKTGIHDREVLIRQGNVDNHVGLVFFEKFDQLRHRICVDRVGCDVWSADSLCDGVTFGFCAGCKHYLVEHFGVLGAFVSHDCADTAGSDNDNFSHFLFCCFDCLIR